MRNDSRQASAEAREDSIAGRATDTHDLDDDYLRTVLSSRTSRPLRPGHTAWEAIGRQLVALAQRDSLGWRAHRGEYQGAYVAAAVELLRRRPEAVLAADRPWGLLVARGRYAGQTAVGAEATGGLTGRDPVSHRVRFADVPRIVSFDVVADRVDRPSRPRRMQWSEA